jgi:hypothetical protein
LFFRDISERKNVEANMNMLSLVASETTIVIANPQGELEWANNAFTKLTGFDSRDLRQNQGVYYLDQKRIRIR